MNKPEFFKGDDDQWYWHIRSPNGQIIATGGEGYTERNDAKEGFMRAMTETEVEDLGDGIAVELRPVVEVVDITDTDEEEEP